MHTHITRAHLKGYRNIRDTEATFREGLNIIIGKNGTGKSNFLWLLANCDEERINDENIEIEKDWNIFYKNENIIIYQKVIHKNTSSNKNIENIRKQILLNNIELFENKTLYNIFSVTGNSMTLLLAFNTPNTIPHFTEASDCNGKIIKEGYRITAKSQFLHKKFSKINYSQEIFNRKLKLSDLNFDDKTIELLKKYTPIQNIRIKYPFKDEEIIETETDITIPNLFYKFQVNQTEWHRWNDLSDGTRRIVWIVLSVLNAYHSVILIEEPELGIHPHQLALLMEFLKDQSANKQIIISTQSPEVLDILEIEELDRISIARYDEVRKTTVIDKIPTEDLPLIAEYMQETGLLSGYWSRLGGLENKPSMR